MKYYYSRILHWQICGDYKMNDKKKPFDWIKLNNRKQCEWAAGYLHKKEYQVNSHELTEADIDYMNYTFGGKLNASETLFLLKMKSAWTQKKSRDKSNGRKSYSFVMSISIEQKLKNIANGYNINQTLELLIEDADKFKKSLEDQKNRYKEEIGAKLASQKDSAAQQIQKLKVQIERLEKTNKIQSEYIERLVTEMLTNRAVLQDNNLADRELTQEQKEQIQRNHDTEMHQLESHIKLNVRAIPWL